MHRSLLSSKSLRVYPRFRNHKQVSSLFCNRWPLANGKFCSRKLSSISKVKCITQKNVESSGTIMLYNIFITYWSYG